MKKPALNPYLPSWEYIPDGEPYVFGDRVYVYGSHDFFNGYVFCQGDYVCWSAPVDDLGNWRYEGVIYPRNEDPMNKEGKMCLYAPDVTVGPDGRYYLYYVLDKVPVVSVCVCDEPAGRYEFYGYVHDQNGNRLGERPGDEPQFDPGVLTEGDRTYLYTGFAGQHDKSRTGAMVTVLGPDMLTIVEETRFIVPGNAYSEGTQFENHAFFEAPSIRKIGDTYYFVYSSEKMHELCYATSKSPVSDFTYRGVIVSNADIGIGGYKEKDRPAANISNNHGGMVQIGDQWYIFYHRHTNRTWYSRQGCAEKIQILEDGSIPQASMTCHGLNDGPLPGKGVYPGYLACNLFGSGKGPFEPLPKIMQDGRDGDEEIGYVAEFAVGQTIGFKYFDVKDLKAIRIATRGYCNGDVEVRTSLDGEVIARYHCENSNVWEEQTAEVSLPDGVYAFYFTFTGSHGAPSFRGFELI